MEKQVQYIVEWIETNSIPANMEKARRFGITSKEAYGTPLPAIIAKAKEIGRNHALALALWDTGIHDARILATYIADHAQVTPILMEWMVEDFDSWDICDQCCMKLFRTHPAAREKVYEWAAREEEFVRRAAFALIAEMTVAIKNEPDEFWLPFFDLIVEHSTDDRNFVKKAVNWALRGIGKRSPGLYAHAKNVAAQLSESDDKTARWIGRDALRELNSPRINARMNGQAAKR